MKVQKETYQNRSMKWAKIMILLFLTAASVQAQTGRSKVREGNKKYEEEQYADAEVNYSKALEENPNNYEGIFNLGDALYKQGRYEEAAEKFEIAAGQSMDKGARSKAFYNMGNAFLKNHYNVQEQAKMPQLQKSIEAYKQALRDKPDDMDAKYNLAYAQKLLKDLQQQQNQQNKDNKDQNKKEQDKKEQDQQKKDEEQDKKDEQKEKEKQDEEKQKEQQQKQDKISREDAKRILDALKNEEAELQKKLNKKKVKSQRIVIEKDW